MVSFPATSTEQIVLERGHYDFKSLAKAVKGAASNTVKEIEPVDEKSFHIHRLAIHASFNPIPQTERYPDGLRENPEWKAFDDIVTAVKGKTLAMEPLELVPSSPDILAIPFEKRKSPRQKVLPVRRGATAEVLLPTSTRNRPLLTIPNVLNGQGRMALPTTTAWDTFNWVHATLALSPTQGATRVGSFRDDKERIHLRTGVEAVWIPSEDDDAAAELRLVITIDAFLDMTLITDALPPVGNDLFRMALMGLIPPNTAPSGDEDRASALRDFYECLRPAPDLPLHSDARKLQPSGMVSKLLPFQKRTLALLLRNEGIQFDDLPLRSYPGGQWEEFELDGFGTYAFSRLTGLLEQVSGRKGKDRATSPSEPSKLFQLFPLNKVHGTMLCEEMGLGKTVEAIALLLLNRHPRSLPRPAIEVYSEDTSREVNLLHPPPGDEVPELRAWLEKEHAAFEGATSWSEESQLNVAEIGTTLVVTPLPLLKQWIAEIATHAPGLRVCVYPGWSQLINQVTARRKVARRVREDRDVVRHKRKQTKFRNETRAKYAKGVKGRIKVEVESEDESSDDDEEEEVGLESLLQATQRAWLDYVRGHDIVITTYQTLGDDLKVAHPAPARSRRSTAKYNLEERPRSPLVMVEWWRVVMDEVQLHSDQSAASDMVSLLPRKNSLAMSGTPARTDIKDLMGSLRFLRVPDINRLTWHRLLQPDNREALRGLFQRLAVRTTKAQVAHEFSLPHQSRFVVPIELSDIELHYYQDTLERQRRHLRDLSETSDLTAFRHALRNLRQICTHIQVGALQRGAQAVDRTDRLQLGRQLMTMEEALKKMCADHESAHATLIKTQMRTMIKKAQLLALNDEDELRSLKAIALYERIRDQGMKLLEPARAQLATLTADREDSISDDLAKNASESERNRFKQVTSVSSLIRESLTMIHQSWFLEGDVRHVLKDEEAEVLAYSTAETIRKEILARPLKQANTAIDAMVQAVNRSPAVSDIDQLIMGNTDLRGAIYTADAVEQVNALLDILNDNATLVFSWRNKIIHLLQSPLEAEDGQVPGVGEGQNVENPDEEYYAEALKAQGDVTAYFSAYAAAIADRKEMLLEERNQLEQHEGAVTKKRTTKRALQALADADAIPVDEVVDLTDKLMSERQAFRDRRKEEHCEQPLKALLITISNVVHGGYREEEIAIAKNLASKIRKYIDQQASHVDKLNKELDLLRATYNKRVLFYSHLQEISDSVTAPDFTELIPEINKADESINKLEGEIAKSTVKGRYLSYLEGGKRDVHEECSICFGTSDDEFAVLLDCGHAFCVSCFKEYRKAAHIGRKCAFCKAPIPNRQFTRIRIRGETANDGEGSNAAEEIKHEGDEPMEEEEDKTNAEEQESLARMADLDRLNMLPDDTMRSIAALDVMGQYGSKITFLIKHLQWYRLTKPSVRHVVFSNWGDSLHIVERALRENHIKFVSFDQNSKKNNVVEQFHADKSIAVFLLHAERESAGLTLTSCGVVHLLEPVLQHSFELQAIGRVDRLGQKKETEVYCYATMETVESRILCQAVRNGTSIYLADRSEGERVVGAMPNVASAAGRGGDLSTGNATANAQLLSLVM